ncbi:hypothetical protein ACLOJK_017383 [Asimina triloba]
MASPFALALSGIVASGACENEIKDGLPLKGMGTRAVWLPCAFATIVLISMAFLPPFAQASRLSGQMMGHSQGEEKKQLTSVFYPVFDRYKSKSLATPFSSQREVPAGPDPIHH